MPNIEVPAGRWPPDLLARIIAADDLKIAPLRRWYGHRTPTWLVNLRLLGKTVFVMPETITPDGFHAYAAAPATTVIVTEERLFDHYHSRASAATREAALTCRLELPLYDAAGAAFTSTTRAESAGRRHWRCPAHCSRS